jgi:IS5 family transposase
LPQLEQTQRITGHKPKVGIADRGYKGRKNINGVQIIIPTRLPDWANNYQKQKMRKRFRARAGIEPIIGHLKQDHRMDRNYLLDEQGDLGYIRSGLEPKICIHKNQGFFTFN